MVHAHGRSWTGATMAPEGKDNVKGQACLGCKRNDLRLEPQISRPCPAFSVGIWTYCPTFPTTTAFAVSGGVPRGDAESIRELGRSNGYGAGRLKGG